MKYDRESSEAERRAREKYQGVDEIRKELEEVRMLKETLKKEIEGIRERKVDRRRRRTHLSQRDAKDSRDIPKPPIPPMFDLRPLTESLSDMMEGLGERIEESMRGIEGIEAHVKVPKVYIRPRKGRSSRRSRRRDREIEKIPPGRVARVISPLGSEERLKILDFLKEGGKSFNDMETYTEKTGSSLTHHLTPLLDAGYVIKGEVRGTYYVTVEGRLAYRLAQWLTNQVERERVKTGNNGDSEVKVAFEDEDGGSNTIVDIEQDDSDVEGDE